MSPFLLTYWRWIIIIIIALCWRENLSLVSFSRCFTSLSPAKILASKSPATSLGGRAKAAAHPAEGTHRFRSDWIGLDPIPAAAAAAAAAMQVPSAINRRSIELGELNPVENISNFQPPTCSFVQISLSRLAATHTTLSRLVTCLSLVAAAATAVRVSQFYDSCFV